MDVEMTRGDLQALVDMTQAAATKKEGWRGLQAVQLLPRPSGLWAMATNSYMLALRQVGRQAELIPTAPLYLDSLTLAQVLKPKIKELDKASHAVLRIAEGAAVLVMPDGHRRPLDPWTPKQHPHRQTAATPPDLVGLLQRSVDAHKPDDKGHWRYALNAGLLRRLGEALGGGKEPALELAFGKPLAPVIVGLTETPLGEVRRGGIGLLMPVRVGGYSVVVTHRG